jgi:hypothetical protein
MRRQSTHQREQDRVSATAGPATDDDENLSRLGSRLRCDRLQGCLDSRKQLDARERALGCGSSSDTVAAHARVQLELGGNPRTGVLAKRCRNASCFEGPKAREGGLLVVSLAERGEHVRSARRDSRCVISEQQPALVVVDLRSEQDSASTLARLAKAEALRRGAPA